MHASHLARTTHLLHAPEVVHALDGVGSAVHDVAKLVARALQLLAVELHDGEGVVVQQLDLRGRSQGGLAGEQVVMSPAMLSPAMLGTSSLNHMTA